MIISTKKGTPKEELEKIVDRFEKQGLDVTLITGQGNTLSQSCFFQNCADSLFIVHFACTSAYSRRRKRSSASLRDIITSRGLLPTD